MKRLLLLLPLIMRTVTGSCHTFGGLHEYCNITTVWTERYSEQTLLYLVAVPVIVSLVTALVSIAKLLYDAVHDLKAISRRKKLDEFLGVTESACRPSLLRYVLGTFIKMYLVVFDAISVMFDVYFVYKLERGQLIDVYITRDHLVLDIMMVCAIFSAVKSILIACIIFLSKSTKNCDLVIAVLTYITQDGAQIILQHFWVEKYLVSSPSREMQLNNLIMLVTALVMLVKHVVSVVRRALKRGYRRLRQSEEVLGSGDEVVVDPVVPAVEAPLPTDHDLLPDELETEKTPLLPRPTGEDKKEEAKEETEPEKEDTDKETEPEKEGSEKEAEPEKEGTDKETEPEKEDTDKETEPEKETAEKETEPAVLTLPTEHDLEGSPGIVPDIPQVQVCDGHEEKEKEEEEEDEAPANTALLKEISQMDDVVSTTSTEPSVSWRSRCTLLALFCGIVLEAGTSLTTGLRTGTAFYLILYPAISSSCLYVEAGVLLQDPFNLSCLTPTDYALVAANFLLPIVLVVGLVVGLVAVLLGLIVVLVGCVFYPVFCGFVAGRVAQWIGKTDSGLGVG